LLPTSELEAEILGDAVAKTAMGTILLQSVESLPLGLQGRLAHVIANACEARRAEGGSNGVRYLAAATRNLGEDVRRGHFNDDLYELLATMQIDVPPLRERREDIPALVGFFTAQSNAEFGSSIDAVDEAVIASFQRHSWPGNVGQLRAVLRRACLLARTGLVTKDEIGPNLDNAVRPSREADSALEAAVLATLQAHLRGRTSDAPDTSSPFHDIVELVEHALVREALRITSGNQLKAAEILGLNRTTLRKKMIADEA
jgi:two-component system nitrogen regulation response regulator GlnG